MAKKSTIKESDRLTDQMFMTQMMTSFAMILLCVAMMCTSAFAYFSSSVASSSNTIRSASYDLDVQIQDVTPDQNGIYVLRYPEINTATAAVDESEKPDQIIENEDLTGIQVQTYTHSFVLTKSSESTASVGFAKFEITWKKDNTEETSLTPFVCYTQPIGTYWDKEYEMKVNSRVIGVEVPEGYTVYVKITSEWGTCSYDGILNSSAISNLEAPDSIHYVSLITTEDYGVEIVDLEEVLLAVTTNMEQTAIETRGLSFEQIIEEIRKLLFVTVDDEEYRDYLLEMDELVLPLEEDTEYSITVVYPGSDIKLRTEVSTVVYLKHTLPVLSVEGENSVETALETRGLTAEQIVEAISSLLIVKLDGEVVQDYELMVDENTINSLLSPSDGAIEVPLSIVYAGTELAPGVKMSAKIYLKHTVPVLSVEGENDAETALETRGQTEEQIVETICNLLTVKLDDKVYPDYELVVDENIINGLLSPTEGAVEIPLIIVYPGTELYPRQEVVKTVYLKHTVLPVLTVTTEYGALENAYAAASEDDLMTVIKSLLHVTVDDVATDEYEVVYPSEWALSEEVSELVITISIVLNGETITEDVSLYVVKAKAQEQEPSGETPDLEPEETNEGEETPVDPDSSDLNESEQVKEDNSAS